MSSVLLFAGLYSLSSSSKISLVSVETVFNFAFGLFRSLIVSAKHSFMYKIIYNLQLLIYNMYNLFICTSRRKCQSQKLSFLLSSLKLKLTFIFHSYVILNMIECGQIEFHRIIWILNCDNIFSCKWLITYQVLPICSFYIQLFNSLEEQFLCIYVSRIACNINRK